MDMLLDEELDCLIEEALVVLVYELEKTPKKRYESNQARRNRQGKIRKGALTKPTESAFLVLFNSKQDDALITLTGFNHSSFSMLLSKFAPLFNRYSPINHRADGHIYKKKI